MDNNTSRILIVDDMPINRIVLSSILATHGIMSDQVESGAECLEMCENKDYDLILLDHRMPDLDGVDTLVRLKEIFEKRGRQIPVICHTTAEGKTNINLYKAAGFADVLIKPIEPKELFEVLVQYLSSDDESGAPAPSFESIAEAYDEIKNKDTFEENADEIDKLPLWLKLVPHIDLVAGIANCGSAEEYMDALYIFHASVDEKSDDIKDFLEGEDWTMYALRVHSLKSMARLIGADKIGDEAALLENAAREGEYATLTRRTPAFIKLYRNFGFSLAPISAEEEIIHRMKSEQLVKQAPAEDSGVPDNSRTVLFIQNIQGIVKKGIENNLLSSGFKVISIPDEPDRIISHRHEADIIVYYPGESADSHIGMTMNILGEISQDDAKIFCLTGDIADIEEAMRTNGSYRVSRTYPRPVNIDEFIEDMNYFADLEHEYHQRKVIYVVDDDTSYLPVIQSWLSSSYTVSCFTGSEEVLEGLSVATPDLILMDFEMPGMNGSELMRQIRTSFPEASIPIIFLTGKNDKEHVFKVLEDKPDGYLLKTSQKDTILDVIHRFFAETMFKLSQQPAKTPEEESD